MIIEDDVIPPEDALVRLNENLTSTTGAITGAYQSRFDGLPVAWQMKGSRSTLDDARQALTGKRNGLEQIGGGSFGCLLIRSELIQNYQFNLTGGRYYDVIFFETLKDHCEVYIDWSIECDHLEESDITSPVLHIITPVTRLENIETLIAKRIEVSEHRIIERFYSA